MKFVTIFDPKKPINFVKYFKVANIISVVAALAFVIGVLTLGMPWGIDFLGGAEMQVKFQKPVSSEQIRKVLEDIGFAKNHIQQFGAAENNEKLIRIESMAALNDDDLALIKKLIDEEFPKVSDQERILYDKRNGNQLTVWLSEPYASDVDFLAKKPLLEQQKIKLAHLIQDKARVELRKSSETMGSEASIYGAIASDEPQGGRVRYTIQFAGVAGQIGKELTKNFGQVDIRKVDFVDSQVSRQLRSDGLLAIIYAILAIVLYIAIRFDFYFSPGAIFSLVNDVVGALLVFVFFRVEFDAPSIAAILTIVGYSVNHTVVIYDRIRETLPHHPKKPLSFDEISAYVNTAINDTLSRTINTTITTLLASTAIWVFGSGSIKGFAIVLSVGFTVGGLSSIFVAPAAFLFARKYFKPLSTDTHKDASEHSREERAKGVV
jgi:preprotein translocase subunit SecF